MEKQIIAAIEIADYELRLLVGQFFNGRLNILKVESVSHRGIRDGLIVSETLIVNSLKKAVENASRNLGVVIDKAILMVPGHHMKRINKQVSVPISVRISDLDVKRAYSEILQSSSPENYILTNIIFTKYHLNGSSTRKVPLNERTDKLLIEADCYYSKQSIIFPYVSCVESSGLSVIDVVLEDIAFAKETNAFSASIDRPIITVNVSEMLTKFSLFHQGVLMSNDLLNIGIDSFSEVLRETLKVPQDVVDRLIYYNLNILDQEPKDSPIFLWSTKSQSHTLSQKDIHDLLYDKMIEYIENIYDHFSPIFKLGKPKIILSGQGGVIEGFKEILSKVSDVPVDYYVSTTFGVKDSKYTSLLGCLYYYKDQSLYRNDSLSSIDEEEFKKSILNHDDMVEDHSITKKLKSMFFER